MNNWEKEEKGLEVEALSEEKREMNEIWEAMVREVLSTTRIDPETKGKQLEMYVQFTGEVTVQHVRALQSSNYGLCFKKFLELWHSRGKSNELNDFAQGAELFGRLSTVTHSCFREIQHHEKGGKQLTDEEVLRKAQFLTTYYWDKNHSNFNVDDVSKQLSIYLASGMEWDHIDKSLLCMSVRRAYDVELAKGKTLSEQLTEKWFGEFSIFGIFVLMAVRFICFVIPRLIGFVIIVGVGLWSINNLDSSKHPILASLGLLWVSISAVSTFIHYGTREIRHTLKRIVRPPYLKWTEMEPFIDADLYALNQAVNHFRVPHTNLRLVREQLVRLQNSDVQFPVQLLTLIDRAIWKGSHYW